MKRKTLENNVVTKVVAGLLAVVVFLGSGAVTQAEEEERYTAQPGSVCMNSETNAWSKSFFIPTQVYQAGGEFYVADATISRCCTAAVWHPIPNPGVLWLTACIVRMQRQVTE